MKFWQMYLEYRLRGTWEWLLTVMDATEAQLRFGASLTHAADPAHPGHPLHAPSVGGAVPGTAGSQVQFNKDFIIKIICIFH